MSRWEAEALPRTAVKRRPPCHLRNRCLPPWAPDLVQTFPECRVCSRRGLVGVEGGSFFPLHPLDGCWWYSSALKILFPEWPPGERRLLLQSCWVWVSREGRGARLVTRTACHAIFQEQGMAATNRVALGLCPPGDTGSAHERDEVVLRAGAVAPVPALHPVPSAFEFVTQVVFYQRLTTVLRVFSRTLQPPRRGGRASPAWLALRSVGVGTAGADRCLYGGHPRGKQGLTATLGLHYLQRFFLIF